ncbi:hypothetical protein KEM54_006507 [Ascosphaera aggregata]|nr:hypothetical protein KEM54_006507 [Ascosphaera aggregata]
MAENQGGQLQKAPTGGRDFTPLPHLPPGFTLRITIHRAENLPIADLSSLSADPYVHMILETSIPRRHQEDPELQFRTPTIRRDVNPVWEAQWIVANVPETGFRLNCQLLDEDLDRDDKLGSVHVIVDHVHEDWEGIKCRPFKVRKRAGSKRAYLLRSMAVACSKDRDLNATLWLSVECLHRTEDEEGGRVYTLGPNRWTRHFSPLIGRLVGTKTGGNETERENQLTTYKSVLLITLLNRRVPYSVILTCIVFHSFQAVQLQLTGPVPWSLYHRYVEFKPFVAHMFASNNLGGFVLNRALHHQHTRIYNYDRSTMYGVCNSLESMSKTFLEFVSYAEGGKIFTYVVTLDGEWRFTETGKEFGIDMLSKHSMHSDVAIYIAFSGEFFVRRRKGHHRSASRRSTLERVSTDENDPSHYELIIDNESGTYRPDNALLPVLQEYLAKNLPGIKVRAMSVQSDELQAMKEEQREKKRLFGKRFAYMQRSPSSSSVSSSDVEDLDERVANMYPDFIPPTEGHHAH